MEGYYILHLSTRAQCCIGLFDFYNVNLDMAALDVKCEIMVGPPYTVHLNVFCDSKRMAHGVSVWALNFLWLTRCHSDKANINVGIRLICVRDSSSKYMGYQPQILCEVAVC